MGYRGKKKIKKFNKSMIASALAKDGWMKGG